MKTTIEDIQQNEITEADISATPFDEFSAGYLADALRANTSINKLNLSMNEITDDDFALITEALISRKTNLIELNVDLTDMTVKSKENIEKLIEAHKVKNLMLYRIKGIDEKPAVMDALTKLAHDNDVKISFDHPEERKSPGYMAMMRAKHQAEQKGENVVTEQEQNRMNKPR